MKRAAWLIASVLGAGYFPVASGTFGTLLAVPLFLCLRGSPWAYGLVTAGLCGLGVWAAGETERLLREKDSHKIVIDEFAGYLVAAAYLPAHWFYPVAAFFLFRILDILKPFPAHGSQKLPGGWGVMCDDLIVAVYTNLALQGARWLLPF